MISGPIELCGIGRDDITIRQPMSVDKEGQIAISGREVHSLQFHDIYIHEVGSHTTCNFLCTLARLCLIR